MCFPSKHGKSRFLQRLADEYSLQILAATPAVQDTASFWNISTLFVSQVVRICCLTVNNSNGTRLAAK